MLVRRSRGFIGAQMDATVMIMSRSGPRSREYVLFKSGRRLAGDVTMSRRRRCARGLPRRGGTRVLCCNGAREERDEHRYYGTNEEDDE